MIFMFIYPQKMFILDIQISSIKQSIEEKNSSGMCVYL